MRTNRLGPNGPDVSELSLGTMTFGVETDEADAHRQLDAFVGAGGTHIDTADVYGAGESERIIGRWLRDRRPDGVTLATKGRFGPDEFGGASATALTASLDASLSRLDVEHVDLYYVHAWDPEVPVSETLGALAEAVAAGKIGAVGWSNTTGWQLQRILDVARQDGLPFPVAFQPQYNLVDRTIEWELLPLCLDEGLSVVPWSPLGGGWLTGKYRRDEAPTGATRLGEDPDRGVEAYAGRNTDRVWRIIDEATAIAIEAGRWIGEVPLRWLLERPGVATVLLGARTTEQLQQSLAVVDCRLDGEALDRLTRVSAPGVPSYPYGMLEQFAGLDVWQRLGTAVPDSG